MGDPRPGGLPKPDLASRRVVLGEIFALWLVTLLLIRGVKDLVGMVGLPEVFLAAVPILFMYAPVFLCRLRGVDSWDYPLALPAFGDREAWWGAVKLTLVVVAVVTVPWLIGYHVYQTTLFPWAVEALGLGTAPDYHYRGTWPAQPLLLVGYHVFFVAIPEEFFYRGYLQTRLDEAFPTRWRILGAELGWGWLLACVFFALGHSLVEPQWWHFAIFFPSLVFGWMRARTGGIVAGALFHAWANIGVTTLDTLYGVVPVSPG